MPVVRYTGGSRYSLRDGPTWEDGDEHEVGEQTADRLTDRPDFELVDGESDDEDSDGELASVEYLIEQGTCPWCDDYEGEHVGQHASSAHADAWADYTEAGD